MTQVEKIISLLEDVQPTAEGYTADCPAHGRNGARLNIKLTEPGKADLFCAKCPQDEIRRVISSLWEIHAAERARKAHARVKGIKTAGEILRMKISPREHVVYGLSGQVDQKPSGLLPTGLSILAGDPKGGKSWAALDWMISVGTDGRKAFGRLPVSHGTALGIFLEDTDERIQERLKMLNADQLDTIGFKCEWPTLAQGGADLIGEWLSDNPYARLIIVDTLEKIRGLGAEGRGVYSGDYHDLGKLKKIADQFRVAIVVIHHVSKRTCKDPFSSINGSMGLSGCADAMLMLRRQRGDNHAFLLATGRDIQDQAIPLLFDSQTCAWSVDKEERLYG